MSIQKNRVEDFPVIEGILTGVVQTITDEGVIIVIFEDHLISCHFVRNCATPPEIKEGDKVLFVSPIADQETGFVLGLVEPFKPKADRLAEKLTRRGSSPEITTIEDEVVRIKADKGLIIECGKGTIIITQDGKVQIKGTDLLSRARGMNRIKGAGVNIN